MTLRTTIRDESGTEREQEASTPQDIGELVEALVDSGASEARIEHTERSGSDGGSDHALWAAVRSTYAYLRYSGPISGAEHVQDPVVPIGHPKSPGTEGVERTYPATTGLELALFTEALHEFDTTAELPTCVAWTTEAQIENNDPRPLQRG